MSPNERFGLLLASISLVGGLLIWFLQRLIGKLDEANAERQATMVTSIEQAASAAKETATAVAQVADKSNRAIADVADRLVNMSGQLAERQHAIDTRVVRLEEWRVARERTGT